MFLSRYIVVKTNNNCEKRGGERVSFSSPQFSIQSKISKKNVFVPWVISEFTYFPQNIVFKRNLKVYYKVRQFVITKDDSLIYYKVRKPVITKCDSYIITKCHKCYYKVRQVLQSVTVLLQSAAGITKCDDYHKVRQNRGACPPDPHRSLRLRRSLLAPAALLTTHMTSISGSGSNLGSKNSG